MLQNIWVQEERKVIVSVDSYDNGVLRGRFTSHQRGEVCFRSLTQFLIQMEELLDDCQLPQSYTAPRSFADLLMPSEPEPDEERKTDTLATFELRVLFRQHSSWQGLVVWLDKKAEQSFRSVLELVMLLDSALRNMEP